MTIKYTHYRVVNDLELESIQTWVQQQHNCGQLLSRQLGDNTEWIVVVHDAFNEPGDHGIIIQTEQAEAFKQEFGDSVEQFELDR